MKMNVTFRATLAALTENKSTDGRNSYYKLAVVQGAECSTISCTQEVYDSKPDLFKNYDFDMQIGEYDGKATYRITRIFNIPSTAGASAPPRGAEK